MVAAVRTERSKSRGHGVRTLPSPPGRGNGICVGTKEARGDVLFFLHADSSLLPGALNRINEARLANLKIDGGQFRSGCLCCATSGVLDLRPLYRALGGFRLMPLMEDLDFVRRLEQFGCTCC